jgi:hypothetical protein
MKVRELLEATDEYQAFVQILKNNCLRNFRAMVQTELRLLRGDNRMLGGTKADGYRYAWSHNAARKTARESATQNNFFLTWASTAPQWKNVPKRTYSTFCTLSYEGAGGFGNVSLVVPFDTVDRFAAMPDDFNLMNVANGHYDLMSLAEIFATTVRSARFALDRTRDVELLKVVSQPGSAVDLEGRVSPKAVKDVDRLFSELIALDKKSDVLAKSDRLTSLHSNVQELRDVLGDQSLISWLQDNVSPDSLMVQVFSSLTALAAAGLPEKSEVWFEGPYISLRTPDLAADDLYKVGLMRKLKKDVLG